MMIQNTWRLMCSFLHFLGLCKRESKTGKTALQLRHPPTLLLSLLPLQNKQMMTAVHPTEMAQRAVAVELAKGHPLVAPLVKRRMLMARFLFRHCCATDA